ncbi:MAG: adenylate/guanylate cyclase domain-containing protein [Chloroflexi bacterium]|nr:adenylate/guanylate cyclase domain-containing protein [Chloroflexota bacterium]
MNWQRAAAADAALRAVFAASFEPNGAPAVPDEGGWSGSPARASNQPDPLHSPDTQLLLYARDLARLQRLRRAYERFLPASLDPVAPRPEPPAVRTASALFTDMRGFTGLAERFADDPAGLLNVVNAHLAAVVGAIRRCGGVIEKFVGDGVLATFGARNELQDHCERALAASFAVVGANESLNRRRAKEWGFRVEVGVGAAAGKVVVGTVGTPERAELGVLGDPLNIAARLVARAKAGEVLLAASVYRGAARHVRADLFGDSAVRGRAGQVEIYRIALLRHT